MHWRGAWVRSLGRARWCWRRCWAMLELAPVMRNGTYWTNINLMGWFWLPILLLTWDALARSVGKKSWQSALVLAALLGNVGTRACDAERNLLDEHQPDGLVLVADSATDMGC